MSRPFKLYRLQLIDSQLDWMRERVKAIESDLQDEAFFQQAARRTEEAAKFHAQTTSNLKRAEDEVLSQRLKIEQNDATLYGGKVRNPKELQDLENEITALKRYLVVLEDRQLEAMDAEEQARESLAQASQELEETRLELEQKKAQLSLERDKLLKDISNLAQERQAAVPSIPPEDLALYENLRLKKRGIAVAKVTDRACSACGSILSSALLHTAHSPDQLTQCETCGRILYIG